MGRIYLLRIKGNNEAKNEKEFIIALNNLAVGKLTEDDKKLIQSREVLDDQVPENAIRLFSDNASVDKYNDTKISNMSDKGYVSEARNTILSKIPDKVKNSVLQFLSKKQASELNGLPHVLRLKIGIKYMMTCNIDVKDGLVNGSFGTLKKKLLQNQA